MDPSSQRHHTVRRIDTGDPATEAELESESVEHVGGVVVDPLHVPFAGEDLLGQRRSVVGGTDSSPMMTTGPVWPSCRISSAARSPASEAPTTTTVPSGDTDSLMAES